MIPTVWSTARTKRGCILIEGIRYTHKHTALHHTNTHTSLVAYIIGIIILLHTHTSLVTYMYVSYIDVGEVSLSDARVCQEGIDTGQVDGHTLNDLNNNNNKRNKCKVI